jgi:hypothetical protein
VRERREEKRRGENVGVLFIKNTPNPAKIFREKGKAHPEKPVGADVPDGPQEITLTVMTASFSVSALFGATPRPGKTEN